MIRWNQHPLRYHLWKFKNERDNTITKLIKLMILFARRLKHHQWKISIHKTKYPILWKSSHRLNHHRQMRPSKQNKRAQIFITIIMNNKNIKIESKE